MLLHLADRALGWELVAVNLRRQTFWKENKEEGEQQERGTEIESPYALEIGMKHTCDAWRVGAFPEPGGPVGGSVGLRQWRATGSGCEVGSDPAEQWCRLRPRTERPPMPGFLGEPLSQKSHSRAEWPRENGSVLNALFQATGSNRTTAVLPPTPSFPGSTTGGVNSSNLQVGLENRPDYRAMSHQTSALLGRFTDARIFSVWWWELRWSELGILIGHIKLVIAPEWVFCVWTFWTLVNLTEVSIDRTESLYRWGDS